MIKMDTIEMEKDKITAIIVVICIIGVILSGIYLLHSIDLAVDHIKNTGGVKHIVEELWEGKK